MMMARCSIHCVIPVLTINIKLSPYLLQVGKNVTINMADALKTAITPGAMLDHIEAQVSFFSFKFDPDTCAEAAAGGKPSSITSGHLKMSMRIQVPFSPISNVKAKPTSLLRNGDGTELVCFNPTVAIA